MTARRRIRDVVADLSVFARRSTAEIVRSRTFGLNRLLGSRRTSVLSTSARVILSPTIVARKPHTMVSASGSSGMGLLPGARHRSSRRARSLQPMSPR